MSPLKRALLAAVLAVGIGLGLSVVAQRLGLISRIVWPAAAGVAVMVAATTFVAARRRTSVGG